MEVVYETKYIYGNADCREGRVKLGQSDSQYCNVVELALPHGICREETKVADQLAMLQVKSIITLLKRGEYSERQIGRMLGIDRKTVGVVGARPD